MHHFALRPEPMLRDVVTVLGHAAGLVLRHPLVVLATSIALVLPDVSHADDRTAAGTGSAVCARALGAASHRIPAPVFSVGRRTMSISTSVGVVACGIGMPSPSASRADPWSDAERSAKDLINYYEGLNKLNKDQIRALVAAIANAEEAERDRIAEQAHREASGRVQSEYENGESRKIEVLRLLDVVLKDPALKDKHRDAEDLKKQVETKWEWIKKASSGLRSANHPVVRYMLEKGKELHATRQRGCVVSEFNTGKGFADCIRTTCDIIEFKPDNDRSKRRGAEKLKDYQSGLQNPDTFKILVAKNPDFARCTQFRLTIEAYTLLPEIADDGSFREVSASWSTYTYDS